MVKNTSNVQGTVAAGVIAITAMVTAICRSILKRR
jgi:hypothetical protein